MGPRMTMFIRIIRAGMLNFVRNAWLAMAAMAIMVITLTIILFSVIANATFNNTVQQIEDKINISVYLKDSVTEKQKDAFIASLNRLENVEKVTYLSKDQALKVYMEQNKGNEQLLSAINETDNPLPATIQIKPHSLSKIDEIRSFVLKPESLALQSDTMSDSGNRREAIDNITKATQILGRVGVIAVALFALISVLIIFNTIRMTIFNRRDELQIMRLLGASTSFIRGPFVVETVIYGVLSAIISILIINALFVTASASLQATSFGLLDISYSQEFFGKYYWELLASQLTLGILIGAVSSMIATRRYLKFKTAKH